MSLVKEIFQFYWSISEVVAATLGLGALLICRAAKFDSRCFTAVSLLSWALLACLGLQIVSYLALPNFYDYAEPLMTVMATNFMNGGAVYHDEGNIVGSLYGPLAFLTQVPFIAVSKTILASKLPGVLWLLCTFAILVFIMRRASYGGSSLTMAAWAFVMMSPYGIIAFWNRPDPALLFLASLSVVLPLTKLRPPTSLFALAVLVGLSVNLKPHAFLYFIPVGVLLLLRMRDIRAMLAVAVSVFLLSIVVALMPYLDSRITLSLYLENVLVATKHDLVPTLMLAAFSYSMLLYLPPLLLRRSDARREELAEQLAGCIALFAVTTIVSVISSKEGGGAYHLIPFLPFSIYLTARAISNHGAETIRKVRGLHHAMLVGVFIAFCPIWAYNVWKPMRSNQPYALQQEAIAEAKEIFARFKGAQMGLGADTVTKSLYYRVFSGFAGNIALFDPVNWQDLRLAGYEPSLLHPMLESCRVEAWVFPNDGEEFSARMYDDLDLFDDEFRATFRAGYTRKLQTKHFSVWTCKKS